jgi:hypothetical protein
MQFIYPGVLWFSLLAVVPLLIHLFNLRKYKTIYFPSLFFLKEIQQETRSVKKVKEWLVLLMRCLALICLVLAFAGPYLPLQKQSSRSGEKYISIFVDNSPSMNLPGSMGTMLDEARNHAKSIAMGFGASDHFQLLTNGFEGKHQRFVTRDEFLDLLATVKCETQSKSFSQITRKQQSLFAGVNGRKYAYILSDFQASQYQMRQLPLDTTVEYSLVKMESNEQNNVCIDTVFWVAPPKADNSGQHLLAGLQVSGESYLSVPTKLFVNGQQRAMADLQPEKGKRMLYDYHFSGDKSKFQQGEIRVQDAPVSFDDVFYFSFANPGKIKVLQVFNGEPSLPIRHLFADDEYANYHESEAGMLNYRELSGYDCILLYHVNQISSGLSSALETQVKAGKTCILIPPAAADPSSWNILSESLQGLLFGSWDTTTQKAIDVAFSHPLFSDVFEKQTRSPQLDLPVVKGIYRSLSRPGNTGINLLGMPGKHALISLTNIGKGRFCQVFQPLGNSYGNLHEHALFLASLYKLVLSSLPVQPLYYPLLSENRIILHGMEFSGDKKIKLVHIGNKREYLPSVQSAAGNTLLTFHQQPSEPGNYWIVDEKDTLAAVSFNHHSMESVLKTNSVSGLENAILENKYLRMAVVEGNEKEVKAYVTSASIGKPLEKWFLILGILFVFTEMLILTYFSYFYTQAKTNNARNPLAKSENH